MDKMGEVEVKNIKKEERLRSLIKLLLTSGRRLKTEIVKLCFLIDYDVAHKRQDLPEGFTTVIYLKYYYGPYSRAFDSVLGDMAGKEITLTTVVNGTTNFYYELKVDEPAEKILEDEAVRKIVFNILEQNKDKSLVELKRMVYDLDCVKKTPFGEEIKLLS